MTYCVVVLSGVIYVVTAFSVSRKNRRIDECAARFAPSAVPALFQASDVLDVGPRKENLVPAAVPRARGVSCGFLEID